MAAETAYLFDFALERVTAGTVAATLHWERATMWMGVIGTLYVRVGDAELAIPAGKQRAVLAALVVRAGHVVSFDELAEAVWDGAPPASARLTLMSYVMRLRRILGPVAGERIVTRDPGYLIQAADDEVDTLVFARLCREGRAAARAADWPQVSDLLCEALRLWRGAPLVDVPSRALQRGQAPRLEEMRLQALETRIDADMHLGRHREVIGELQALAAQHPLRERLHALLMLGLYRDGRQGEALTAYQRARDVLAGELGIEPGPELREMQRRVLAGDPELAVPSAVQLIGTVSELAASSSGSDGPRRSQPATRPTFEASAVVPRQLPAAVRHFVGRADELKVLTALLDVALGEASAPVISAIGGTAGVGKSALAVHFAHQVADRFADGQLYVNLHGFGPSGTPVLPEEAVRWFLGALEVPADRVPADLQAQASLYRSLLAGKRMLIVLDNANDSDQIRPLLPGSPGCLVLVTSRAELTGLASTHGAYSITVNVLTDAEARELLTSRLGAERAAAEPDAADELIRLCTRLPLALSIAAARITARPGFPLALLVTQLRDAGRLDALDAGDEASSVRAVFSWSYRALGAPAARVFRLLGLHPGPDFTIPAAASLAGVPLDDAAQALAALTRVHLLAEHVPGRFEFHDLLRAYAAERAGVEEDETQRRAAVHRVLDHYLRTAGAADRLLYQHRDPVRLAPPRVGSAPVSMADQVQALAWFEAEHRVLVAAVDYACDEGFDTHAWQLAWTLETFFHRRGHSYDWSATQRAALVAAERAHDTVGQAHACRGIGAASIELGIYEEAQLYAGRALALFGQLSDLVGQARVNEDIGRAFDRQGSSREAHGYYQRALALFRTAGHQAGQGRALNEIGWCLAMLGDYQPALEHCQQAVALCLEIGDRHGQAYSWDSLGYVHRHLGNRFEAVACFERAIRLKEDLGDQPTRATSLDHLGDAQQAAGNPQAARDAWLQALAILGDLRHPGVGEVRAKLRGLGAVTAG